MDNFVIYSSIKSQLRFLLLPESQVDPELPETSAQDRRPRPPRVLQAPGSRVSYALPPSLLHHMTYVGADGMDGPPPIIHQGHLQPVGLPDPARCQIGEQLIDVSRSKRRAPPRSNPCFVDQQDPVNWRRLKKLRKSLSSGN